MCVHPSVAQVKIFVQGRISGTIDDRKLKKRLLTYNGEKQCLWTNYFQVICLDCLTTFDLDTLDSGERSLPFGLLVSRRSENFSRTNENISRRNEIFSRRNEIFFSKEREYFSNKRDFFLEQTRIFLEGTRFFSRRNEIFFSKEREYFPNKREYFSNWCPMRHSGLVELGSGILVAIEGWYSCVLIHWVSFRADRA